MSSIARTCSIENCSRKHYGRNFCKDHYMKWYTYGDPLREFPKRPSPMEAKEGDIICSIDGCSYKFYARDLCMSHWRKLIKYGDPLGEPQKIVRLCSVDGCGAKYYSTGYCKTHYDRMWRRGKLDIDVEMHGMTGTPEYASWQDMKSRCNDVNQKFFSYYGGRGIKPCKDYNNSFTAFYRDLGDKPTTEYTLDRVNNEAGYTCGKCEECIENGWAFNCRWATRKEQSRNTRLFSTNKTGYSGLQYWPDRKKKWQARFPIDGSNRSLGYYYDKEDAIKARKAAELKYWGKTS